jgi:hypothetical protein
MLSHNTPHWGLEEWPKWQCLPSKHEALSSNPSTTIKTKIKGTTLHAKIIRMHENFEVLSLLFPLSTPKKNQPPKKTMIHERELKNPLIIFRGSRRHCFCKAKEKLT